VQTRRELTREATIREIKQTALARMRAHGTLDFRLSDVARDMRMSAPGLYRYFDGRDGLLTALITDAFVDLAVAVETARDAVPAGDTGGRFLAVARAYRRWALESHEKFALIFGPPIGGYRAPEDGPTLEAAKRAMDGLRALLREADQAGTRRQPRLTELPPVLRQAFSDSDKHSADPATELALAYAWTSLHGFVTLEAHGSLDWHGPEVNEAMFLGLVRLLADVMGLPDPTDGWPSGTPSVAAGAAGRASAGSSPAPGR
jgi:AcrR family transcriptional regulator